jgi:hypothetical protein
MDVTSYSRRDRYHRKKRCGALKNHDIMLGLAVIRSSCSRPRALKGFPFTCSIAKCGSRIRYGAAKPTVRGIEQNKVGEPVIDGNIYVDMLPHLYMVEKA